MGHRVISAIPMAIASVTASVGPTFAEATVRVFENRWRFRVMSSLRIVRQRCRALGRHEKPDQGAKGFR